MAFVTLDNVYKRYHMGEITINSFAYTHLTLPTKADL